MSKGSPRVTKWIQESIKTSVEKTSPQNPNSFRKRQTHTASQAKLLCRKYKSSLHEVFEKKQKKRQDVKNKTMTFLSDLNFFQNNWELF